MTAKLTVLELVAPAPAGPENVPAKRRAPAGEKFFDEAMSMAMAMSPPPSGKPPFPDPGLPKEAASLEEAAGDGMLAGELVAPEKTASVSIPPDFSLTYMAPVFPTLPAMPPIPEPMVESPETAESIMGIGEPVEPMGDSIERQDSKGMMAQLIPYRTEGKPSKVEPAPSSPENVEEEVPAPSPVPRGDSKEPPAKMVPPQPAIFGEASEEFDGNLVNPPISPSGKGAAIQEQTMKTFEGKNKFAGSALQKLPSLAPRSEFSSTGVEEPTQSVGITSERANDMTRNALVADWVSQPAAIDTERTSKLGEVPPANSAADQVERLGALISRQTMTFRQTGATQLGVSLKLDAQTQIFLDLTRHAGVIQVSIRCERGDLPGLENHWGELQESLARQNVQLLPIAQSNSSNHSTFGSTTNQSSQNFAQARQEQNREPQLADLPDERSFVEPRARANFSVQTAEKTLKPQGWESWA